MLSIKNLKASREDKPILNGVNLEVKPGEIHAIMGPNGSGKSTFASALMGHPAIEVDESSEVELDGIDLMELEPDQKAKEGLFLAFQYPVEVTGVPYLEFLRLSYNSVQSHRQGGAFKALSPIKFRRFIEGKMDELKMDKSFIKRSLNEGFSGGEKKKSEILQMAVLEPKYAILDETDSGLDVTALKIVGENAKYLAKQQNIGLVVITHYKRLLEYLNPDFVHVFVKGKIVDSGDSSLADKLDKNGYEEYLKN